MFSTTAVPQTVLPRTSDAVWETAMPETPTGWYFASTPVPTVFGLLAWAKEINSGAGKVTDPPPLDEERNGSTAKKKKKLWCGITGPPTAKSMLLEWKGL